MNCKHCNKELIQVQGKESKVFCSDRCRKAYNRKLTSDTTSDKSTADNSEQATSDITTQETSCIDNSTAWVPNWKKAGYKTREEAEVEIMRLMSEIPGHKFMFKGYTIDTTL